MHEQEKQVFLCRHLPTKANISGVIMGRSMDLDIADGSEKLYRAGLKKINEKFEVRRGESVFYSSPMLRCKQTCAIAISELSSKPVEPVIDERLNETDCGSFAGFEGKELKQKYPELVNTWMYHPDKMRFPGGESYTEVQVRVSEWLKEALQQPCDNVFAFTHVDAIKMLLFSILSIPISHKRNLDISTGSFTVLAILDSELVVKGVNLFPLKG